jgi:hypothetical protein
MTGTVEMVANSGDGLVTIDLGTPEPSSVILLAMGLLAIGAVPKLSRVRRRAARSTA